MSSLLAANECVANANVMSKAMIDFFMMCNSFLTVDNAEIITNIIVLFDDVACTLMY